MFPSLLSQRNGANGIYMSDNLPRIEKGIPIDRTQKVGGLTSLMRKMKVGDSFLVDKPKGGGGNFHMLARFADIKIMTRSKPDNKMRVWRIS